MTRIWVPKLKIIEPKRELSIASSMKGFFKLQAKKADGRIRPLTGWFPNLITNSGLNLIGGNSGFLQHVRVGTGSAEPNVNDTSLQNQVAISSTTVASLEAAGAQTSDLPYYGFRIKGWEFGVGVAEGNLTEIGVGPGTAASPSGFFSRALILDESLDPTSITVLGDEILQVQYEIRMYPPIDDVLGSINISGDDYDTVIRAAFLADTAWAFSSSSNGIGGGLGGAASLVRALDGELGGITSSPSGAGSNSSSVGSISEYGNNDFYRDRAFTWGIGIANYTPGIRSISARFGNGTNGGWGGMQVRFDPVIPKTSSDALTLNLRHRWARFEGYDT